MDINLFSYFVSKKPKLVELRLVGALAGLREPSKTVLVRI